MAWPPTTHQDAADEITSLRDGKGWATTLGGRQRFGESLKAAPLLWVAGRWQTTHPLGALSTLAPGASELRLQPFYAQVPRAVDRLACNVSTASATAGHVARLGIYNADPVTGLPTTVLVDAGSVAVDTAGVKEVVISVITLSGLYWFALTAQSGTFTSLTTNSAVVVAAATSAGGAGATTAAYTAVDPTTALPDRTTVTPSLVAASAPAVYVRTA